MAKRLLPLSFLLIFACALAAQAPPNDNCTDAIDVSSGQTVSFNTIEATTDGPLHLNSPCPSATNDTLWNDVWYRYTADFTGLLDWSLCGTASYDTKIAVYKGGAICPLQDSDLLTCNDDFGTCTGSTSRVIFNVAQGESYLLRLGGWGDTAPGASGDGTFTLEEFIPSVPNDLCDNATAVNLGANQPTDNTGAITDGPLQPGNSACFGFNDPNVQADIWYSFTSPITGTVEWSTCDQVFFDSRLAVYGPNATCTPAATDLLACNDDGSGCSNYTSRVVFDVEEGATYLLRLGGYNAEQGNGTFSLLEIAPPVPPANDLCADADSAYIVTETQANDFDFPINGTNINGTFEADSFIYPNTQCFDFSTTSGEFSTVWYWINTLGNSHLEIRLFIDPSTPGASFYLDMFDACNMQVDTNLIMGSCLFVEPGNDFASTTVSGFPDEPTVYLLRVTTRVTSQLPGNFFFFVIGDITEPPVGVGESFPGHFRLFPNPAGERLYMNLILDEAVDANFEIVNALGQKVQTGQRSRLAQGAHQLDFDVSNLGKGMYYFKMNSGQGAKAVKFLKG